MVWGTGAVVHSSSPTEQGMSLQREGSKGSITREDLAFPGASGAQTNQQPPQTCIYPSPHHLFDLPTDL